MDRMEKLHLSSNVDHGYCFKQGLFVRLYEQRPVMTRDGKVRLSLGFDTGHAFAQGLFMRLYEASLCWFIQRVRPLKIMAEKTKQGEVLLLGETTGHSKVKCFE